MRDIRWVCRSGRSVPSVVSFGESDVGSLVLIGTLTLVESVNLGGRRLHDLSR